MQNRNFWTKVFALILILAVALPVSGALAQDGDEPIVLPEVDPLSVTGDIAIAGSSTVEPVTVAMAARFNDDGFSGNIAVAETGTSAGFERFCKEGSTDISNASRAIKEGEVADCEALGREVLEFYIGIDALTVAVNKDSVVDQLKRSELFAIFTGQVTVERKSTRMADEAIQLFTPGTDSGTFDYLARPCWARRARMRAGSPCRCLLAPNPTTSESDYTLVEGILGSEYAIGYFGFAYYIENEETLAVAVANDMTTMTKTTWLSSRKKNGKPKKSNTLRPAVRRRKAANTCSPARCSSIRPRIFSKRSRR
jgi:ABC-type phosphate transport system substrate-binding protein